MSSAGPFGIYFLDVGQGDCSFVCPPASAPILVDCADATIAQRFIEDHPKLTELEAVVVSHLDDDHIRGMLAFLRAFMDTGRRVKALYIAIDRPRLGGRANELIDQAIEWGKEKRFALCAPTREAEPRTLGSGPSWRVDLVLPWYDQRLRSQMSGAHHPNALSAVVRISVEGHVILIGGDAPLGSWERLEPDLLKAHVFRAPHHGGDISAGASELTVADLYRKVAPQIAVFSVGTTNRYQHPSPQHVADAAAGGGACRRLCTQLTPRCHPNPLALRDEARVAGTYSYSRYRDRGEVPCAGSVVVIIDNAGHIKTEPPTEHHDAFIARTMHPLCRTPVVSTLAPKLTPA